MAELRLFVTFLEGTACFPLQMPLGDVLDMHKQLDCASRDSTMQGAEATRISISDCANPVLVGLKQGGQNNKGSPELSFLPLALAINGIHTTAEPAGLF